MIAVLGLLCLTTLTGCIATDFTPGELELNGKIGWVCSIPAAVVGVGLDIVCTPITVPWGIIAECGDTSTEPIFPPYWCLTAIIPGVLFEYGAYEAVAAVTYPVQLAAVELPSRISLARTSDADVRHDLLMQLPNVRPTEYRRLVAASGRAFAPGYTAQGGHGALGRLVLSGHKSILAAAVENEWWAWVRAGEPAGGAKEAEFVIQYWVMDRNPESVGYAVDDAQLRTIEKMLGVSREEVERYAASTSVTRRGSHLGPWKFWVVEHGGVQEVVRRSPIGQAQQPPQPAGGG
jgi:hypothetical protein